MTNLQACPLPTVFLSNNTEIDSLPRPKPDNYTEVRGRSLSTNRNISRDSSMFSTMFSVVYYERMVNNNINVDEKLAESTYTLSYEMEQEKAIYISKVAEQ